MENKSEMSIAVHRIAGFREALLEIPWIKTRLAQGQQFNVYEDAEAEPYEDCMVHVAIGPITNFVVLTTVESKSIGNLIANALTLASLHYGSEGGI